MADVAQQLGASAPARAVRSPRRHYMLGILTAVYALNFLDRTIFNVLIEPIKKEFALSDTTMGLPAPQSLVADLFDKGERLLCRGLPGPECGRA